MKFIFIKVILIVVALGCFAGVTKADTWDNPKIKRYFSANGDYMVEVTPTTYPEKYWEWTGASSGKRKRKNYTAEDTTIIFCQASMFNINGQDTAEIWNQFLINQVAPYHVIVSNDGNSIVTFDNWHNLGYGRNVVVIYDGKGHLIARYPLKQFSPFPLEQYEHSISSIWWGHDAIYIDDDGFEIVCMNESREEKTVRYHIPSLRFINP